MDKKLLYVDMAQVFITHSSQDRDGKAFFDKLFASSTHKAFWYSWEGPEPPHSKKLLNAIRNSASLFVILSSPMEEYHTISWVGYEVGIAAEQNKPIWVFEYFKDNVKVPVPYVSGYVQYPGSLETKKVFPYNTIVEYAGRIGGWTGMPIKDPENSENGLIEITCGHPQCLASYYTYTEHSFFCPVCRNALTIERIEK